MFELINQSWFRSKYSFIDSFCIDNIWSCDYCWCCELWLLASCKHRSHYLRNARAPNNPPTPTADRQNSLMRLSLANRTYYTSKLQFGRSIDLHSRSTDSPDLLQLQFRLGNGDACIARLEIIIYIYIWLIDWLPEHGGQTGFRVHRSSKWSHHINLCSERDDVVYGFTQEKELVIHGLATGDETFEHEKSLLGDVLCHAFGITVVIDDGGVVRPSFSPSQYPLQYLLILHHPPTCRTTSALLELSDQPLESQLLEPRTTNHTPHH